MPDGSIKKTTITRRTVEAPTPADRPADPYPSEALVKYNVDRVNAFRAKGGLPPLKYDAKMSAFARKGSEELSDDHTPINISTITSKARPASARAPPKIRAIRAAFLRSTRTPRRAEKSRSISCSS